MAGLWIDTHTLLSQEVLPTTLKFSELLIPICLRTQNRFAILTNKLEAIHIGLGLESLLTQQHFNTSLTHPPWFSLVKGGIIEFIETST